MCGKEVVAITVVSTTTKPASTIELTTVSTFSEASAASSACCTSRDSFSLPVKDVMKMLPRGQTIKMTSAASATIAESRTPADALGCMRTSII